MPSLNGAVVLVTGANGGIGTEFVHQALARGAAKVYATARTPKAWDDDRVVPLTLDVNSPASRAAAALAARDVTVLINNAGMFIAGDSILNLSEAQIRETMETNFFGPVPAIGDGEFDPVASVDHLSRPHLDLALLGELAGIA